VRDAKLATRDMHAQLADPGRADVRLNYRENKRLKDMLAPDANAPGRYRAQPASATGREHLKGPAISGE
jgi:hypothetical protein